MEPTYIINKDNFINFKNGVIDVIKIFKVQFDVNKISIVYQDKKLFINNIERILDNNICNDKAYQFGFNFVLKSIIEFRNKLCINPILYLILFENCLNEIRNYDECIKLKKDLIKLFDDITIFRKEAEFNKIKLNKDEVVSIQGKFLNNDFLKEVCDKTFSLSKVKIIENKFNSIEEDPYYSIKVHKYNGISNYKNIKTCFWWPKIKNDDLINFINIHGDKLILLIFNDADDDVKKIIPKLTNIICVQIPGLTYYDKCTDLKYISNSQQLYLDPLIDNIENYIFGNFKEVIFKDSMMYVNGIKFTGKEMQLSYLRTPNNLDRLLMIRGDSLIINCKEDLIENVRSITSTSRSLYNYGPFYSEEISLNLFYKITNNLKIKKILVNSLKDLLKLYNSKENIYHKIFFDNNDKYYNARKNIWTDDKSFIPWEYYDLSFNILISNLEVLKGMY